MQEQAIVKEEGEKYKYQKKDFVQLGVPAGSFYKLMESLELNSIEYKTVKLLKNGKSCNFYTQEAMDKVADYLSSKNQAQNRNELSLIEQKKELEHQLLALNSQMSWREAQVQKELGEKNLKIQELESQKEIQKWKSENQIQALENKVNQLTSMNWWQFHKYKKNLKKQSNS